MQRNFGREDSQRGNSPSGEAERSNGMRERLGLIVLAAAILVGIVICVLLAAPFLGALAWALTLATLFAPLQARIEARLGYPSLTTVLSVLIVLLVVAIPAAFVVQRLVEEAANSASAIQARVAAGALQDLLDAHPGLAPIGSWIEEQIDLAAITANLTSWLSNLGASFARGSIVQMIEFVLVFYLLYYFLRDRHAAGKFLREWLPLTHDETERLFRRVSDTIHATIYGTLAVSAVQGTLGGFIFWILDLPTPLLWGLVMGLLSIVPVLGAFVVWIPAAVLLALDGNFGKAAILAAWGAVVVGGIDNLLRPIFVGNRLSLHTVPAFISMIGGFLLFGASGFILGPLAVTVTILLVEIFRERYGKLSVKAADPESAE